MSLVIKATDNTRTDESSRARQSAFVAAARPSVRRFSEEVL